MNKDMKRLNRGKTLLAGLGLLLNSSCRDSVPPKIEICIGDGFGGADCIETDGSRKYKSPSELLNYWMTSESDEANYTSWCYGTSERNVQPAMKLIRDGMKDY